MTQPSGLTQYPAPLPYHRPLPPPPTSPGGQPLADFGTRLLAYLIDGAIVGAVVFAVFTPVILIFTFLLLDDLAAAGEYASDQVDFVGDFLGPLLLVEGGLFLLLLAGYYVYHVEIMHRSGQTVGKKAMKIRVVPIDPAVPGLTRGMAAKRYLVEIGVALVVPFFAYLDGLWQLWDKPYQQTLHDKYAQTVVVKVAP